MPIAKKVVAPVGILAVTLQAARSLAQELKIQHGLLISPNYQAVRGRQLSVLLVQEGLYPLTPALREELLPTLQRERAYIIELKRHDPDE